MVINIRAHHVRVNCTLRVWFPRVGRVLVGFCYSPCLLKKYNTGSEITSYGFYCLFRLWVWAHFREKKRGGALKNHFITHLPEGLCCLWHFKPVLLVWFSVIKGKFWFIRFWVLFSLILVNMSIVYEESNLVQTRTQMQTWRWFQKQKGHLYLIKSQQITTTTNTSEDKRKTRRAAGRLQDKQQQG